MKSTLVEPPPDSDDSDEEIPEFIRANSVQELARKTNIGNQDVLDRVLLPGKRFGSYHILGFVAAGGMGEIYAAQRIKSDGSKSRPVALKVITAEFAHDWRIIERFKREARISKAIRSRHVARVYEFGESPQGHVFLAMELLEGEELFDRLHRRSLFSPLEVAELTLQILKGLHRIHDSGYVHRDIKPENVFFAKNQSSGEEDVKILDFGIAKEADKESDPLLSVAGQIYGTPQYIAPEQAINPDVDHRADLYSLGVLMYECVTGSLPFDGESSYDIIVAHQKQEVPPLPSSVDPEFAQIVYTALTKDPDDRFQSAIEMGRVLKRWRDETSWVDEDDPSLSMEMEVASSIDAKSSSSQDTAPAADYALPADPNPLSAKTQTAPETKVQQLAADSAAETLVADDTSANVPGADSTAETLVADDRGVVDDSEELQLLPSDDAPPGQDGASKPSDPAKPPAEADAQSRGQTAPHPPSEPNIDDDQTPPSIAASEPRRESPPTDAPEDTGELTAAPDVTTEFRNPRHAADREQISEKDTRNAQVITGVALGLLILAILWALFL